MRNEQLEKIRSAVEEADHIPEAKKRELLDLIGKLEPALAKVAETHDDHAQHIAGLVEASAHAASRKNPKRLEKLLRELKESAQRFEASHPDLTSFVTEYSAFLSALGI